MKSAAVTTTALLVLALTAGCRGEPVDQLANFHPGPPPAELAEGQRLFQGNCQPCHGVNGTGSDRGPPLVHRIYEPSHHADAAFQLAVQRGVAPHHWRFGAMPPLPGVTPEQVARITAYVRWLQRSAGIE